MHRPPVIPTTFAEWSHCIEVECGIRLTDEYIAARLALLRKPNGDESARFRTLYGERHWQNVIGWFEQAQTLRRPA